jgi:hypothetical protein
VNRAIVFAILGGFTIMGLLIGGGIYLGLRAGAGAAPSAISNAPPASGITEAPRSPATSAAPMPSASPSALTSDAASAITAQKPSLVDACWKPSIAKSASPPSVSYTITYIFAPGGRQLARSVKPVGVERADVTECIERTLTAINVRPSGTNPEVSIPLTLP